MPFCVNGSAASLAPYSQEWEDLVMGRDHNGAPILSAYKNILLTFDSADAPRVNQWTQFCNTGTSVVSVNVLNLDQTSYIAFSGVFLEFDRRPRLEAALYMGPWSIRILGAQP